MSEAYFIGAYWRARYESADGCAAILEQFFERLATPAVGLAVWYATRPKRTSPSKMIDPRADAIKKRLSRNYRDFDHIEMPELGFDFDAWAHLPDASSVAFRCHIGAVVTTSPNSVILEFGPHATERLPSVTAAFDAVVDCFKPEFSLLSNNTLMRSRPELDFFDRPAIATHGKW